MRQNIQMRHLACQFLSGVLIIWTSVFWNLIDLQAQIPTYDARDTVLVKSTYIPQASNKSGRNITVLGQEFIRSIPHLSWDEILQRVPGLEVQSRNGFGAQADLLLRGSTFTQVLILLDGVRLNDPLTGHFNGNIPIPVVEIERIEILRGPAAAIYGPDAVGGVIHFITKNWEQPFNRGLHLPGQMTYGRHNLWHADQGVHHSKENFSITAGAHVSRSDGEPIAEKRIGNMTLDAYRNFFDVRTLGISSALRLNPKTSLHARTTFDRRRFSARYFYTNSPFDKSTEETSNWWSQARLIRNHRNSITTIDIAHRSNQDEFIFSPDFPSTNNHNTKFSQIQINHQLGISSQLSFKGGVQFDRRSIRSNDRGDHQDAHLGFYGMALWQPNQQTSLSASGRVDYDANYQWEFSPQLNASLDFGNLTARFSMGRSIRAADYTERYVSNNLMNLTPGRSLGNPELVAEQSWSEEVGLDYRLGENLVIRSTFFARQSRDLIDYIATVAEEIPNNQNLQTGELYFFAQNIARVRTRGAELELWYQEDFSRSRNLQIGFGYTHLNTSIEQNLVSVYLSNHAKHLLTSHYILAIDRWHIGLTSLFKSRNERFAESILSHLEPQYLVFDALVKYALTRKVKLRAQVNNLLDQSYANILGAPMPGRWWMLGVAWDL